VAKLRVQGFSIAIGGYGAGSGQVDNRVVAQRGPWPAEKHLWHDLNAVALGYECARLSQASARPTSFCASAGDSLGYGGNVWLPATRQRLIELP
jgi:hypothetical protein